MRADRPRLDSFALTLRGPRVVFGEGVALTELARETDALGASRVLVLGSEREQRERADVLAGLGTRLVGRFTNVRRHVPRLVADAATELALNSAADCLLSIGGGSAVGTAKAVALSTGLPIVAIPTTYAGSEVTPIYGITDEATKRTGRSEVVLPKTVLLDPTLTWSLPGDLTRYSAVNALAHCVSGMFATDRSPITDALAAEGATRLARGLRSLADDGKSTAARADLTLGAYFAGTVLAHAGTSAHHAICHIVGGAFDLPHAQTHAAILPAAAAFLQERDPTAGARLATALKSATLANGLSELLARVGASARLRDIGLDATDLPHAVKLLVGDEAHHGVAGLRRDRAEQLLRQAW